MMKMEAVYYQQNSLIAYDLATWLSFKSSEDSLISQAKYHLSGRIALLGASLLYLAEAVTQIVIGSIAFIGYLMTLGYGEQAKNFSAKQMQKGSYFAATSLSCFRAIIFPKELGHLLSLPEEKGFDKGQKQLDHPSLPYLPTYYPVEPKGLLTPQIRDHRIRQGAGRISDKLQKQFKRAQNQAAQELDNSKFHSVSAQKNLSRYSLTSYIEQVQKYKVGICHFIGKRQAMEDTHLTASFDLKVKDNVYPIQLFGIFDGHGGKEASLYVSENLKQELHRTLNEFCSAGLTDETIWNALKITFVRLNDAFKQLEAGTTATIAMILDKKLWTANVGDSRIILDNGVQLSEDAKPADDYYKKGIEHRGGIVLHSRINGNCAVARAVGDHSLVGINTRPKITVYPLSAIPEGSHLILACDGIYDVASTRQIAAVAAKNKSLSSLELAQNIVHSAYKAGSTDNLSALVVKL